MPSELKVWRATSFEGGRNTQSSEFDLSPSESPDDLNMDPQEQGAIRRRKGFLKFSETVYGADAITGLYRYYRTNGDKFLMVLSGPNLWAGRGTPPDDQIIKTDLTPGSEMFFIAMQDWCYFVNFLDPCERFDGTDARRLGLPAPATIGGFPLAIPFNSADGRISPANAIGYYTYRFRWRYGKLGTSNLSSHFTTAGVNQSNSNTVRLSGVPTMESGGLFSLNPAGTDDPTHLQIYRSLEHTHGTQPTNQEVNDLLFYRVDEIKYPEDLHIGSQYIDVKGDVELLTVYPPKGQIGHTFSEPHLDDWMTDPDTAAFAHLSGYGLTPKVKYVSEHRNRIFYAGVEETVFNAAGEVEETITSPSRLYWSELYQPDRWIGFIDVLPEDGDDITQIFSFHNNLIIFKRSRTYLLLGSSPANFEVRLVNAEIGLVASRAIATLDNRVIFYAGRPGIYAFDGSNFARISNKIRPDLIAVAKATREFTAAGSHEGRFFIGYEEEE